MYNIREVKADEVFDSRGNPTVRVKVWVKNQSGTSYVPSGKSTGKYEAYELRDGGERLDGMGVLNAVRNVNKVIRKKLIGVNIEDQENIDKIMINLDGTENKSRLGANAILGVSMACARARALAYNKPLHAVLGSKKKLPVPFLNVINGGKHASNKISFQEFMIAPKLKTFTKSFVAAVEIDHKLGELIRKHHKATTLGDEGGFAPELKSHREALNLIEKVIKESGYNKIDLGMDVAASEFYKNNYYNVDGKKLNKEKLLDLYIDLIKDYKLISLEDPFEQNDFDSFAKLLNKVKNKCQVVGDDITVTNVNRMKLAKDSCNVLLLKINQIGTLSEAKIAFDYAKKMKWKVMVSHRSGETCDSFISDLAVGWGAEQIKAGAPARSERVAKYNRLMEIERELGWRAKFG